MVDIRKIIIIFVVAVLFSVLVFAVIEAIYPAPQYEDFCKNINAYYPDKFYGSSVVCPNITINQADRDLCTEKKGYIEYSDYDTNNCPQNYVCNTCQNELTSAEKIHSIYLFYISAVLALIAIFIGLFLPAKENSLNEWVGTGFMLGGTFALLFGTATSFVSLDRFARPVIILAELILVIYISYKKMKNLREDRKKKNSKR
ncbi:MAG: hypothetical protein PHQ66_01610 [Candidatus Nanoarchaeia archaeon]|nr:hypothetical protein [Candidatus Nanoarchaeia archaeon]MDD5357927.1 hypothetical protein [Candidatus Nanoarchaeia archaeon]MDD5588846.1 hypothetical protein [Candidatus Nanoarchaeia archaeon]